MFTKVTGLLAAAFFALPLTATAATVDIHGKTYQVGDHTGISLSAKLDATATTSVAWDMGLDFDASFNRALSDGDTIFSIDTFAFSYLWVLFDSTNPFTLQNEAAVSANGRNYFVFDLAFAPTTATVDAYDMYEGFAATGPQTFNVPLQIESYYDEYMIYDPSTPGFDRTSVTAPFDYGGYVLSNTYSYLESDFGSLNLSGVVMPAGPTVTPVPLPGSVALLAMGLLGLGVAKRRAV